MNLSSIAQYSDGTYTTYSTSTSSNISGAFLAPFLLIWGAFLVLMIVSLWKIFKKAGKPGWTSIVPIYNSWVLFEIVGYPGWWALLSFVPIVNIFPAVMMIVSYYKLAKLFGKGDGFAVCNIFFPIVTMPMLAFGSSTFQGTPVSTAPVGPQAPQYPQAGQAPQAPQAPEAAPQAPQEPQPPVTPQPPQSPQGPLIQ